MLQKYNTQNEAKSDSKLKRLAEIEYNMTQGLTGFSDYYYGGKEKMMAYCPVPGTDGWSIDIAIVTKEFMGGAIQSLIVVAALVVAVILAVRLSNPIATPVKITADRLKKLADGDLKSQVASGVQGLSH